MSDVIQYILMRSDLASLNAGKACAQAAHAANMCVASIDTPPEHELTKMLREWEDETSNGFGTTIVLAVDERKLRSRIAYAKHLGLHAGILHDPTYPLMDGASLHLIPLDTCGFIFARKSDAFPVVGDLSLYP